MNFLEGCITINISVAQQFLALEWKLAEGIEGRKLLNANLPSAVDNYSSCINSARANYVTAAASTAHDS
jgi:hypothetical protein